MYIPETRYTEKYLGAKYRFSLLTVDSKSNSPAL
jgi:hypothetical protein